MNNKPIAIGITGASGFDYALRLMEQLIIAGETIHVVFTEAAHALVKYETDLKWPSRVDLLEAKLIEHFDAKPEQVKVFGRKDWLAPMASGSNPPKAMVVVPCTMGTLSSIANGASDTLLNRAADVMIKEQRKLIIVPRETPLSAIHLEHMLKLARLGVVMLDANPGYYYRPQSVQDIVDFVVARILDHLGVENTLAKRWGSCDNSAHN